MPHFNLAAAAKDEGALMRGHPSVFESRARLFLMVSKTCSKPLFCRMLFSQSRSHFCATSFGIIGLFLALLLLPTLSAKADPREAPRPLAQGVFQPVPGAEEVDVALVLAVDVSLSMDMDELALQREGYIEALTSRPVLDAIRGGMLGKIGVTYFEWAGSAVQYQIADWHIIEDAASARAFVDLLKAAPIRRARRTSITGALDFAFTKLKTAPYRPIRRVIDVSGDGPNNEGGLVSAKRDEILAAGVTINGLPIVYARTVQSSFDIDGLDTYYRDCVIGGPNAFMIAIRAKDQFPQAIRSKILREVAQAGTSDALPGAPMRTNSDCQIGERMWQRNWER
jgi:Protein of unknown function (DUF1194)